ncbi:endothelin-converting enzyme 2-like isoform X2 [Haemaphysalis longicornis]
MADSKTGKPGVTGQQKVVASADKGKRDTAVREHRPSFPGTKGQDKARSRSPSNPSSSLSETPTVSGNPSHSNAAKQPTGPPAVASGLHGSPGRRAEQHHEGPREPGLAHATGNAVQGNPKTFSNTRLRSHEFDNVPRCSPPASSKRPSPSVSPLRAVVRDADGPKLKKEEKKERGTLIAVGASAGFLLLLAVLVILVTHGALARRRTVATCKTQGCLQHASDIRTALNPEVNPCNNFYQFACGNWELLRVSSFANNLRSRTSTCILDNLKQQQDTAGDGTGDWVTAFYTSCVEPNADSLGPGLRRFVAWKHSLGLLWPEKPQTPMPHPLDVLLNLAFTWNINVLFATHIIADHRRSGSKTLLLTKGTSDAGRVHRVDELGNLSFNDYVAAHLRALNASPAGANLQELKETESAIYAVSHLVDMAPVHTQVWFPLNAINAYMPSMGGDLWHELIAKHVASSGLRIDVNNTVVIAQSSWLLTALNELFQRFASRPEKLLEGIAWIFVQMFLWAVSGQPQLRFHPAIKDAKQHACLQLVESRLGVRAAAAYLRYHFSDSARAEYTNFIHELAQTLQSSLSKLSWTDDKRLGEAQLKLSNVTVDMFPPDEFFNTGALQTLYGSFEEEAKKLGKLAAFIDYFLLYSETLRSYLGSDLYESVYRRRLTDAQRPLTEYVYFLNSLQVSMLALQAPLYSRDGTFAMNFGGLGSYLTRELSRTFDTAGTTVDSQGHAFSWWGPTKSSEYQTKLNCRLDNAEPSPRSRRRLDGGGAPHEPIGMFPHVTGLEAAFRAYRQAIEKDVLYMSDVVYLPYLEHLTDNQIFFITYCHVMCVPNGTVHADRRCNLPLRNFKPFAEAFDCPMGSPMNPEQKCSFFETDWM